MTRARLSMLIFCGLLLCSFVSGCVRTAPVSDAQTEVAIRSFLKSSYSELITKRIGDAAKQGTSDAEADKILAMAQSIDRIQFTSLKLSGTHSDNVVRAEITIDGQAPPDGKSVRYFRMKKLVSGSWTVKHETNEADFKRKVRIRVGR